MATGLAAAGFDGAGFAACLLLGRVAVAALDAAAGFDFGALGLELSLSEKSESDSELESESDLAFFLEAAEDFGAACAAGRDVGGAV